MDMDPMEYDHRTAPVPPSYEQCVGSSFGLQADYVASPLEVAALFDWDEEDD